MLHHTSGIICLWLWAFMETDKLDFLQCKINTDAILLFRYIL